MSDNYIPESTIAFDEIRSRIPDIPERFHIDEETGLPYGVEIDGTTYAVDAEEIEIPGSIFFDKTNPETKLYQEQLAMQYASVLISNQALANERHMYQQIRTEGDENTYDIDHTLLLLEAEEQRFLEVGDNEDRLSMAKSLHAEARRLRTIINGFEQKAEATNLPPGLRKIAQLKNNGAAKKHELELRNIYYTSDREYNRFAARDYYEEALEALELLFERFRKEDVAIIQRKLTVHRHDAAPINIKRLIIGDYVRRGDPDSWNGAELGAAMAIGRAEKKLGYEYDGREITIHTLGNLEGFLDEADPEVHMEPTVIEYDVDDDTVPGQRIMQDIKGLGERPGLTIEERSMTVEEERLARIIKRNMGLGGRGYVDHIALFAGKGFTEASKYIDGELHVTVGEFDLPTHLERRSTHHEIAHWLDKYLKIATLPQYEAFAVAFEFNYDPDVLKGIIRNQRYFWNELKAQTLHELFASQPPSRKRWGDNFSKSEIYYVTGAFMSYLHRHFDDMDKGQGLGGEMLREFYESIVVNNKGNLDKTLENLFRSKRDARKFVTGFLEYMNTWDVTQ